MSVPAQGREEVRIGNPYMALNCRNAIGLLRDNGALVRSLQHTCVPHYPLCVAYENGQEKNKLLYVVPLFT